MRLTIKPLSSSELKWILAILNAPANVGALSTLETQAREYSIKAFGKYLKDSRVWRNGDEAPNHVLRNEWDSARAIFAKVISRPDERKKSGFFFELPRIGLPAQNPPVILQKPDDLMTWLLARAVANKQHLRFVRCAFAECGKFGLRERGREDARFCSIACQIKENTKRALRRSQKSRVAKKSENFGEA